MIKYVLVSVFIFYFVLFSLHVSAQPTNSGSTVINATIGGVWILNISLEHPEITIPEDYYFYVNGTVFQRNSQNISVYLNKSDANSFVKFVNQTRGGAYYQDYYTIYLPTNTSANYTLRIYVPPSQGFDGGTYNIPIYAYSLGDFRVNATTLEVHVNNTNPIDDIDILSVYPSTMYPGESMNAEISIHKMLPLETTDVQICYCINSNPNYQCGPSYNNYGCAWKAINEWLNYTKTVIVNENTGNYYFIAAVKYPNDEDIKRAVSTQIYVRPIPSVPPGGGGPGGGGPPPVVPPSKPKLLVTSPDYLEGIPGEMVNFGVGIENEGVVNAFNTTIKFYGIREEWVTITPRSHDIEAGKSKNYSVSISLPGDAYEQVYSLFLVAKSGTAETTKTVMLTVAATVRKRAKFLLDEARSNKRYAEEIISGAKGMAINMSEPEKGMAETTAILDDALHLFETGDYEECIAKTEETIDGYRRVMDSVKKITESLYLKLLEVIIPELGTVEFLPDEKYIIESVSSKINESMILQQEERVMEAYEDLLEARQLLDQLEGKAYFRGLSQNIVIISIMAVMATSIIMVVFYKKKISKLLRNLRIEEHKKNLRSMFKREVSPGVYYRERTAAPPKAKPAGENLEEMRRFLQIGEALFDTDTAGAKDAYIMAKKIYNSLSQEEKNLAGEEIIRLNKLYNGISKR